MTSLTLLLWIASGILLQLAIYLGFVFWRHWTNYRALPEREIGQAAQPGVAVAAPASSGFSSFRVDRKVVEDAALSICSFYLAPENGQPLPPFLPGQFLTFRLDVPTATGEREQIVRCYSLSDAPRPDCYRITIKRVPPPAGSDAPPGRSSNYFHEHISVGSLLQVRAPSGHFHIDLGDSPVVLIAGGIGFTPMLSMLNWCLTHQPGREVWLFYGVRNSRELAMSAHLENLAKAHANFHLWVCMSNPMPDDVAGSDYRHAGRIDISLLRAQLSLKPYHFYLCGPARMLETLVPALEEWGVPDERIHFEAFGPASVKRRSVKAAASIIQSEKSSADIQVNFTLSGKQLSWQPSANSLLEFAEAHGVPVNSGCRAGSCGSCQTKLRAGEVSYRQPPDYDPEPGACLPCVCTPKTSITLEL
jgi:hypothetical protein